MKKLFIIIFLCAGVGFSSCEMDLTPYNDSTNRMQFVFANSADSLINFTFAYYVPDVVTGTIELTVTAVGFLSDQDRRVTISQTNSGEFAAVNGVHYLLESEYVIPANQTGVTIPLTLLRDESLQEAEYTLDLALVANDDFQLGEPQYVSRRIVVSDILVQPAEWGSLSRAYLGNWGREKMLLMIEAGAEYGVTIDPQWLLDVVEANDYGLIVIWLGIFNAKLIEINEQLGEDGPLTEENGTVVVFP